MMIPDFVIDASFFQAVSAVTGVIAAVTALVAVFWGPREARKTAQEQIAATGEIAQKQIWASSVSAARKEWNDQLRLALVDWLSALNELCTWLSVGGLTMESYRELASRVEGAQNMIHLLVSPDDPLQKNLKDELWSAWDAVQNSYDAFKSGSDELRTESAKEMGELRSKVIAAGHAVLDAQWEKVKAIK